MNDHKGYFIYNVTTQVDKSIAKAWLKWLTEEHIPQVMKSGCFTNYKVVHLLEIDESEGPTYAIQYAAASKADYNRYLEIYANSLRKQATDKWGDRFISFRSLMEVIH